MSAHVQVTQFSQLRREGGVFGAIKEIYTQGGAQGFFKVIGTHTNSMYTIRCFV
jgi:hypothetical protein